MASSSSSSSAPEHHFDAHITLRPSQQALRPSPAETLALHAENRARLVAALRADGSGAQPPRHRGVVLLAGGEAETRHETDHEKLFRQESFFHWAFGVREPDWLGALSLETGEATLFMPRLPEAYAIVMGRIRPPAEFRELYGVESVRFIDELPEVLAALCGGASPAPAPGFGKAGGESQAPPGALLLLKGFNTDGRAYARPASFAGIERFGTDTGRLWPAMTELRAVKTAREVRMLRYSAAITSEGHIAVMQHVAHALGAGAGAGAPLFEYQLESLFHHWCYYFGGCRHLSYTCICAAGHNGSVLHYGHAGEPNAHRVSADQMCLFDMGAEFVGTHSEPLRRAPGPTS